MKRWQYREFDAAAARRLEPLCGGSRLLAQLLVQRGVRDPEAADAFLHPRLASLHDPYLMLGMHAAVERLSRAIEGGEKILVYGDYDVDGTTAIVLLLTAFRLAGGRADYHTPHRVSEGYGMRTEVIERAAREDCKLVISVDTGIREGAVVARARELGIDTIITDHHLPEDELPPAVAVLNPNQSGCGYPDKGLCGAGVAFKLCQALLARQDWRAAKLEAVLTSLLKLVAIGTVADMVPLRGENRVFAKVGLEGLRQAKQPGLRALLDVAGVGNGRAVTSSQVAFQVAPRLNAAGRMDTARLVVELFTTNSPARASEIAGQLNQLNRERQDTERGIVDEIVERLKGLPPPEREPAVVVEGEGWHPGVVGIVASRIVERFSRPALVLSHDSKSGLATGSGRSIPAYHLLEGLDSAADLFERFGGHRQAAGCTLSIENIPELRSRLNDHARAVLKPGDFVPVLNLDAELQLKTIDDQMMSVLRILEPHGLGNPTPTFSTSGLKLASPPHIIKERHVRLNLGHAQTFRSAMGWRMAERVNGLKKGSLLDAAYTVEADEYWGGWQLVLEDFRPAREGDAS